LHDEAHPRWLIEVQSGIKPKRRRGQFCDENPWGGGLFDAKQLKKEELPKLFRFWGDRETEPRDTKKPLTLEKG